MKRQFLSLLIMSAFMAACSSSETSNATSVSNDTAATAAADSAIVLDTATASVDTVKVDSTLVTASK